jgi:hypothetical protein
MKLIRNIVNGAAAGAAGTSILNAVTYLDMAVRGRPASETPEKAVETLADRAGHPVPGEGETKQNRLAGLGPLSGLLTGIGIGSVAGFGDPILRRIAAPAGALVVGLGAMLATDLPMARLQLTRPQDWSLADWLSDLVPHLAYGAATYATLRRLND